MASRLWVPVPSGALAPLAAGYGSGLSARGYSRWTVADRLWQLGLLSRWLEREGVSLNTRCRADWTLGRLGRPWPQGGAA
jgi:hypothetical protein